MFLTNIYEKFALPLSEPLRIAVIASTAIHVCCAVLSITGNLVVLLVYHDQPRLRTKVSSLFTINLALCDLVIGLILLPLMIITNVFILCDQVLFLRGVLESCAMPFLSSVSIWTVFGASVDRLIAMRCPHRYPSLVTRKRVRRVLVFAWIYSSTWIWFPFLPGVIGRYLLMLRSFLGIQIILAVFFCWVSIYSLLRRRRRARASRNAIDVRPNSSIWYNVERKVAKTSFCVTIILYACFLPLWVRAIGHFFGSLDNRAYEVLAITLNLSNCALNPIIYSFTSKVFRSALLGQRS